jgi:hypothetical protein
MGASPYVARGPAGPRGGRDARRLDMPGLLREADAFLAESAAQARAQDPLTARERVVAELVAQA